MQQPDAVAEELGLSPARIRAIAASHCTRPPQYSFPNRTTGKCFTLPVWISVSASNSSSIVPKPPGNTMNAVNYKGLRVSAIAALLAVGIATTIATGGGGSGKTRLGLEACVQMLVAGGAGGHHPAAGLPVAAFP